MASYRSTPLLLAALLLLSSTPFLLAQAPGPTPSSSATGGSTDGSSGATASDATIPDNQIPRVSDGEARAAPNSSFPPPPAPPSGWIRARASWYGTPHPFVDPFISSRGGGESAFGILEWGGCGYTNADGSLAFDKTEVGSYADANPDFPGSCGRCYEVQCVDGVVLGLNDTAPYYGNWYYYPEHGSADDTFGRSFPGNPAESEGHVYVKCWQPNKSVRVHVVDICPCWYSPKGQEPYEQPSCCYKNSTNPRAGQWEFDLSFWVYEQLAHPMYPEMMLNIRPVDCDTGAALPQQPGYIDRQNLYKDMVGVGWSWFPYETPTHNFNVTAPGWGQGGSTAACAEVSPGGGMTWWCRGCYQQGYQPLKDATSLSVALKDMYNPGNTPPLKIMIAQQENDLYCPGEAYLNSISPTKSDDGWLVWNIPFSQFACTQPDQMDKVSFQNVGSANSWFCLDNLVISSGGGGGGGGSQQSTKKRLL